MRVAEAKAAPRHLACLHEITRLFLRSQETATTLSEVFSVVVTALPLRTAVLIEERQGNPRTHLWNAPDAAPRWTRLATTHARTAYAYLADYDAGRLHALEEAAPEVLSTLVAATSEAAVEEDRFIVLPLVVGPKGVFGALQLQCVAGLDESDSAFADALTSELALALDRQYAWELHDRLLAAAEAAVQSRDETLAVVSHDLRAMLGGILLLSAIGSKEELSSERRRALFSSIDDTAQRMQRLIADLVDAATMEGGQFSVARRHQTPSQLVNEALEMMRPSAQAVSLALHARLSDSLLPVLADGERVLQVFANLLSNAIRHSAAGGAILIRAEPADGGVLFSVADTGSGIDPADLPHVFDRYWRTGAGAGAGLGLFIARSIVEAHGGRIWVESRPGSGARFCFTLPAATSP